MSEVSTFCSITDVDFLPEPDDPVKSLYSELYNRYRYAFRVTAETLQKGVGLLIQRLLLTQLLNYVDEQSSRGSMSVCSYLSCRDDAEVDLTLVHEELIRQHGHFILPALTPNGLEFRRIEEPTVSTGLQHHAELRINQVVSDVFERVPEEELTHVFVPGIPMMTYEEPPVHTGWMMPRHRYGYDRWMDSARKRGNAPRFVGVGICPILVEGSNFIRDEMKKPKVEDLVTPFEVLQNVSEHPIV